AGRAPPRLASARYHALRSLPSSPTRRSSDLTDRLAGDVVTRSRPGDLLVLTGPLGAGKTTLTKAIARQLGSTAVVTSPTYTLVQDRKSTRLNSSHVKISYAVSCLKKHITLAP